jgi:hypothetical protein
MFKKIGSNHEDDFCHCWPSNRWQVPPRPMDQITVKTPNPKWRLYWRLIEFIDWRYSQSCSTPLVNYRTSNLLTGSPLPLPHFPVWISTGICIYTVCNRGRGAGCGEIIYRSYTRCIWPDSEPKKLVYHPKRKPRGEGGLRQINPCRQFPLQFNF